MPPGLVDGVVRAGAVSMQQIFRRVRRRLERYRDLELRLNAVEAAVVCLAESPKYVHRDELGLNGQRFRKMVFARLVKAIPFEVAVETGTWLGDSTGYLATTMAVPVYSCELHRIPHTIAKMRLADLPHIHLELKDSRAFLRDLAGTAVARCPRGCGPTRRGATGWASTRAVRRRARRTKTTRG